ncbi:uncharacterized protein H6S33_001776 [Morchella sextelata]|uniref:uncharacterized protein n=1 Tax=Morchella sextelata TaxID=1174677 RepID=UPI001D050CF3|nr:uncharacterized protein H6S33_001776 [Morchella sextelata]KAH0608642.1 hypothetical protein H6S33_001776 [Morchella sextelata]
MSVDRRRTLKFEMMSQSLSRPKIKAAADVWRSLVSDGHVDGEGYRCMTEGETSGGGALAGMQVDSM